MPINKELLEILCCPLTKKPVTALPDDKLALVNDHIARKQIKDVDGNIIDRPLTEALLTEDRKTIYRIDEGIPVMLIGSGIPTAQVSGL
ncbi:MAG: Trm112 family protein [candidate division Zixibacteria bacterium]|nr:Trm112 family protein [candidate division Zixibacteria bacterium]